MTESCWACGGDEVTSIFRMADLALSSLILVETREEAQAFPLGDVELAVCHHCAFVFNRRFDPTLVDYTMPYESSQVFSPRFRAFAEDLIDHLVTSYPIESGEILEIGCGDGSFLVELARRARAKGIGIDPTFDPGRIPEGVDVSGIADFYDADRTYLTADLICCRHTLEHIQPVADFVDLVRRSALRRPGATVFFEIPDTDRILDEGAFWDVYNEHCSYFTLPSLSYLFRSRGFEVLRLAKGFDDQYLLIDTIVGEPDSTVDEEATKAVVARAQRFGDSARSQVDHWRRLIDAAALGGQTVVLWGASSKAVAFLAAVSRDDAVAAAVDINPYKQDKYLPGSGVAVVSPEALLHLQPRLVIVMNPIYVGEIGQTLAGLGLAPELYALGQGRVTVGATR